MQTSFAEVDGFEVVKHSEVAAKRLLEAIRAAVDRASLKEVAFRLDVQPSLLADALAGRSNKGVRAAWLPTILALATDADARAILTALAEPLGFELKPVERLTAEQLAERYEEKLRSLGPIGAQLIREARGGRP